MSTRMCSSSPSTICGLNSVVIHPQEVLTVSGCPDLNSEQLIALTWGLLFPETHAFGRSFKNPPYFDRHHGSWIPIRLMKHEIRVIKSVRFVRIGRPQPRRG